MSKLITSSSPNSRSGKPNSILLEFSDWGKGAIFSWYHGLTDHRAKSIQKLQIRKDTTGPVPHRFIVLHMSNNRIHRFDRRPDRSPDTNTNTAWLLVNQAVTSQDTCMHDIDISSVETSECEIELTLKGQVDLLTVISACYAISNDDSTREYTLWRHNCFFFSWTVLLVVSRHYLPYEVPSHISIMGLFKSQNDRLTSFIVEEAITLFLDLFTEIVTVFRTTARQSKSIRQGQHVIWRAVWSLPDGVVRLLLRQMFNFRLHFGLRVQLHKKVGAILATMTERVYNATASEHMTRDIIEAHLWIEETKDTIREGLEKELRKILWESILEAISSGFGDIEVGADQLSAQRSKLLKYSLLARNIAQGSAVWNGALHGGLQAAKRAGDNIGDLSHDEAFERTWFAVCDGALDAAQTVVEKTSAFVNDPKRDRMWASLWAEWNEMWKEAHKTAQPRTTQTLDKIVKAILDTAVGVVVKNMGESELKTIQVCVPGKREDSDSHRMATASMTNATLQDYMQDIIRRDTVTAGTLREIRSSMDRIWKEARQQLQISATLLDTIAGQD